MAGKLPKMSHMNFHDISIGLSKIGKQIRQINCAHNIVTQGSKIDRYVSNMFYSSIIDSMDAVLGLPCLL